MVTIATVEPTIITGGDTIKWNKQNVVDDLGNSYPASAWTLTYKIYNSSVSYDITATADGDSYNIVIPKGTTDDYVAGDYKVEGYVTDASERFRVYTGYLTIKTDTGALTSGAAYDFRTDIKKTLDAIQIVIQGRASEEHLAYTIAGRRLDNISHVDLLVLYDKYKKLYLNELDAEKISLGKPSGKKMYVRFKSIK